MLVSLGMLVASYCLARLLLVPLTQPGNGPPSKGAVLAMCTVVVLGCLGVSYSAWALLGQATPPDDRPRVQVR